MARPIQKCPMCQETKEVTNSHLLPESLYAHLHDGKSHPILVRDGVVMTSDRHIKSYLLCLECEDILSKGGETWVCPRLGWWEGRRFPLYDMLEKAGGYVAGDGEGIFYARHNPQIEVERITHFALGIFWRAGVHSWRGDTSEPMIDLGWHEDDIRLYLRGEASFPKAATFTFVISPPARMQVTMNQPVEVPVPWGWRVYTFHALGVLFTLNLGYSISTLEKATCFYRERDHPVLVSEKLARQFEVRQAKDFQESRKTAAYIRQRDKRKKPL